MGLIHKETTITFVDTDEQLCVCVRLMSTETSHIALQIFFHTKPNICDTQDTDWMLKYFRTHQHQFNMIVLMRTEPQGPEILISIFSKVVIVTITAVNVASPQETRSMMLGM